MILCRLIKKTMKKVRRGTSTSTSMSESIEMQPLFSSEEDEHDSDGREELGSVNEPGNFNEPSMPSIRLKSMDLNFFNQIQLHSFQPDVTAQPDTAGH
jgi:hypothetical protein